MSGTIVAISLGSNLGDRLLNLRRAISKLAAAVRVVRVSSVYETEPLDAQPNSPPYLNAVIAGVTPLAAAPLLEFLLNLESGFGRVRRSRNEPRTIDLDLLFYDCRLQQSDRLTLPHPRYKRRNFVLAPLNELQLSWTDPSTGRSIAMLIGEGKIRNVGSLY